MLDINSCCGVYTLEETCPSCGKKAVGVRPPKYSPDDKYSDYRRKAIRPELEKKGLI